jgi:hypothetical protein
MTVSNDTTTLLDSVLSAQNTQQDASVSVLKKAQDAMKSQGEAMAQMLSQLGPQSTGSPSPILDAYA